MYTASKCCQVPSLPTLLALVKLHGFLVSSKVNNRICLIRPLQRTRHRTSLQLPHLLRKLPSLTQPALDTGGTPAGAAAAERLLPGPLIVFTLPLVLFQQNIIFIRHAISATPPPPPGVPSAKELHVIGLGSRATMFLGFRILILFSLLTMCKP